MAITLRATDRLGIVWQYWNQRLRELSSREGFNIEAMSVTGDYYSITIRHTCGEGGTISHIPGLSEHFDALLNICAEWAKLHTCPTTVGTSTNT